MAVFYANVAPSYKAVYLSNLTRVNVHVILERNKVNGATARWMRPGCTRREEHAAVCSLGDFLQSDLTDRTKAGQDKIK